MVYYNCPCSSAFCLSLAFNAVYSEEPDEKELSSWLFVCVVVLMSS